MRWEDEPYVKVYTRDTPEFLALELWSRCLLHEIIRKVDRAGILKVGKLGLRGIAVAVRSSWSTIEPYVTELLEDGRIIFDAGRGEVLVPNHIEAQETAQSDASRKRKSREMARAGVTIRDHVESQNVTESSRDVTSGHIESLLEENRSDQNSSEGDAPAGAPPDPRLRGPASGVMPIAVEAPAPPRRTDLGGLEPEAYAEGLALATGGSCAAPRGAGNVQALRDALRVHGPEGADAEARRVWLRDAARDYAVARKGGQLSPRWFVEWLDSGRPAQRAPPGPQRLVQPVPAAGRLWKIGDAS